jgi:hypothetical protein
MISGSAQNGDPMKLAGFGLLFSGWLLLVMALGVLPTQTERAAFVLAGLAVEILGLVLAVRAHRESSVGGRD